jgi:hypothetical protein
MSSENRESGWAGLGVTLDLRGPSRYGIGISDFLSKVIDNGVVSCFLEWFSLGLGYFTAFSGPMRCSCMATWWRMLLFYSVTADGHVTG